MSHIARITRTIATSLLALVATVLLGGCGISASNGADPASAPVELRVSAAGSLRDVLERTAPAFERDHGVALVFNFGASGLLQKQIEGGAPADAFVSASEVQVDSLISEGFMAVEATSTFAGNDIVIFVPRGNPGAIAGTDDLIGAQRIVTGNPDTAPHGTKAREWLKRRGLWDTLRTRFVFAENAAQTLDYVSRGEVDAGICFGSEACANDRVEVVDTVPGDEIKPVRYVAGSLISAEQPALAASYVSYLSSIAVQHAFSDAGFLPAPTQ